MNHERSGDLVNIQLSSNSRDDLDYSLNNALSGQISNRNKVVMIKPFIKPII